MYMKVVRKKDKIGGHMLRVDNHVSCCGRFCFEIYLFN